MHHGAKCRSIVHNIAQYCWGDAHQTDGQTNTVENPIIPLPYALDKTGTHRTASKLNQKRRHKTVQSTAATATLWLLRSNKKYSRWLAFSKTMELHCTYKSPWSWETQILSSQRKCREHLSNLPPHRDNVTHQVISISHPCYDREALSNTIHSLIWGTVQSK